MQITTQSFLSAASKILLLAAVCAVLWLFRSVVLYILISIALAIVFRPVASAFGRISFGKYTINSATAAALTLLVIWIVVLALGSIIVPIFIHKIQMFCSTDISGALDAFHGPIEDFMADVNISFLQTDAKITYSELMNSFWNSFIDFRTMNDAVSNVVSLSLSGLVMIFSTSFITFFFLKDPDIKTNMLSACFKSSDRERVAEALRKTDYLIQRYFTGLFIESLIISVVISISLALVGMPLHDACFIAIGMGVMNIIPYAGPFIGSLLAIFTGIVSPIEGYTAFHTILLTVSIILVVKGIDDFIIQPLLYSDRVNAHPLEVFLVILIVGSLFGIVGMLAAIPIYTAARVFAKEFYPDNRIVRLLTSRV